MLARPILQEYDASTVVELAGTPPQSNLWKRQTLVAQLTNLEITLTADLGICKRHNLVEIAEACRREAKYPQKMVHSVSIEPTNARISLPAIVGS